MSGSKIRLYGSTSGFVELEAPAVAPDGTLTLPSTFGGIGSNVVQATKTDTFSTTSTSDVLIPDLQATITPSTDTSKVLIIAQVRYSNTSTGDNTILTLYRGSTRLGPAIISGDRPPNTFIVQDATMLFIDSPGVDTAVAYEARVRASNGTAVVNRRGADASVGGLCTITVIEVAA